MQIISWLGRATRNNPVLCLAPILIVFYFALSFVYANLEIITSPSIDHKFLWKGGAAVERGNFVKFVLSNPVLKKQQVNVTKKVTCVSGDTLTTNVEARTHFCNNVYLGKAKEFTKDNAPLPFFVFNGEIPEGYVFVSGTHADSFDSRYWGFLDLSNSSIVPLKSLL